MRIFLLAALAGLLCACGDQRIKDCTALAGPGWTLLAQPPANAAELLSIASVPVSGDQFWFAKGADKVLVCNYSRSLTIPGCGGSNGYAFVHKDDKWLARGQLIDFCDNNPDHGD